MAKKSRLSSLSINVLVKMRDEIGAILGRRAEAMKKELRALGEDYKEVGRIAIYGKKNKTQKSKGAAKVSSRRQARKATTRSDQVTRTRRSGARRKKSVRTSTGK